MNNTEYCCEAIEYLIKEDNSALHYKAWTREYLLTVPPHLSSKKNELTPSFKVEYCLACGKKLPSELVKKWSTHVNDKLAQSNFVDIKDYRKIPQEFTTETWWRKRKL